MSHTNYCFAGFTKAVHARIEEIDQRVVEYCRVDIVQQWEGPAALQLLEICMYVFSTQHDLQKQIWP